MTRWQEDAQILRGVPMPSARRWGELAPFQPSYAKASVAIAIVVLIRTEMVLSSEMEQDQSASWIVH